MLSSRKYSKNQQQCEILRKTFNYFIISEFRAAPVVYNFRIACRTGSADLLNYVLTGSVEFSNNVPHW